MQWPNHSLHLTCASPLRGLSQAGELKRWASKYEHLMHALRILAVAGVLAITGCAVAPTSLPESPSKTLQTLGVISLIGDSLHLVRVGFIVFENRRTVHSVPSWGLDRTAAAEARNFLESAGKYKVLDLDYDATLLARVHSRGLGASINLDAIRSELQAIVSRQPVDGLIMLTKSRGEDSVGQTNQFLEGLGLYARGNDSNIAFVAAYAWYEVTVIEAKTLQPLASRVARVNRRAPRRSPLPSLSALIPWSMPFNRLDAPGLWKPFDQLTEPDVTLLTDAMKELLTESLRDTFLDLGLLRK